MGKIALLALHWQNDVFHPNGKIRVGMAQDDPVRGQLIANCADLLQAARDRGWYVVQVRIAFRPDYADMPMNMPIFQRTAALGACRDGEWGAEFYEPLAPAESPREFTLTHNRISGFYGTGLEPLLRHLGVQRLLVSGVATHSVVESTVRDAADRGWNVTVVQDACTAADAQAHKAALNSMSLMAHLLTTSEVLQQFPENTDA